MVLSHQDMAWYRHWNIFTRAIKYSLRDDRRLHSIRMRVGGCGSRHTRYGLHTTATRVPFKRKRIRSTGPVYSRKQ